MKESEDRDRGDRNRGERQWNADRGESILVGSGGEWSHEVNGVSERIYKTTSANVPVKEADTAFHNRTTNISPFAMAIFDRESVSKTAVRSRTSALRDRGIPKAEKDTGHVPD